MAREPETRKATRKILEMVKDGMLERDTVILACLNYMSEADVADMACANDFFDLDDDEETEDEEESEPDSNDEINEVDGIDVPWKGEFPSK